MRPMSSPFDLDADENALAKKPRPIGWFVAGAITIASAAFVLSYYLPLSTAHATLASEYEKLAEKSRELDHSLRGNQKALESTEAGRAELQKFVDGGSAAEKELSVRLTTTQATAENQLEAFIKAKLVELSLDGPALEFSFKDAALFRPGATTLSPRASLPLCRAVAALTSEKSWTVTVTTTAPSADKDYWKTAGEKSAALAVAIEKACQVDASQIIARSERPSEEQKPLRTLVSISPAEPPHLDLTKAPATKSTPAGGANATK